MTRQDWFGLSFLAFSLTASLLLLCSEDDRDACEYLYYDFKVAVLNEEIDYTAGRGAWTFYENECRIRYKGQWITSAEAKRLIHLELRVPEKSP